jgi:hypothetical protein
MGQVVYAGQRGRMLRPEHPLPRLHHLHLQLFRLRPSALVPKRRGQVGPCWLAWKDAPPRSPSFSSPSLAPPALPPASIGLGSGRSRPGWPCWSACLDAPPRAPSSSSPLLAPPALPPASIGLGSGRSRPGWPCWSACLNSLAQIIPFARRKLAEDIAQHGSSRPSS